MYKSGNFLDNLLVVNFPTGENFSKPFSQNTSLRPFHLESCARQLSMYPLSKEDDIFSENEVVLDSMDDISANKNSKKYIHYKKDIGYWYLLRVVSGIDSAKQGEYFIKDNIKNTWNKFQKKNFSDAKAYTKIINNVFEDVKFIRKDLTHIDTPDEINSCIDNVQEKGQSVLIIGDKLKDIRKLLKSAGKDNSRKASKIYLTRKDSDTFEFLQRNIDDLKKSKKVCCPVELVDFDAAMSKEFMGKIDSVYSCLSSDKVSDNLKLIRLWTGKKEHTGNLVCFNNKNSDLWKSLGLKNYISSEMLQKLKEEKISKQRAEIRKVEKLAIFCTLARRKFPNIRPKVLFDKEPNLRDELLKQSNELLSKQELAKKQLSVQFFID